MVITDDEMRMQVDIPPPESPDTISHEDAPKAKRSRASRYRTVSEIISGVNQLFPEFTENLYVVQSALGKREAIREIDRIVELVPLEHVATLILGYTQTQMRGRTQFEWDMNECRKCAEFWLNSTTPKPMPRAVAWSNDADFAFSRVPWRRGENGPTPLFDELFSRLSNGPAFKAWIGSLFDETSDRQQYVWIYGDGDDGKGSLSRFLKVVFGNAYRALDVPTKETRRFWGMQLTGMRLGVFPDTEDYAFTKSGYFKSLTGGDPIVIEEKGGGFWTKEIGAKFLFLSNERPRISSSKADQRRIVYCEIQPFAKAADPGYERGLIGEGGAFITKCIDEYERLCPSRARIPTELAALEEWVSIVEEDFTEVAERRLNFSPALSSDCGELWRVVRENFKGYGQQIEFLKWLERKHAVKKKTSRMEDGSFPKRYVGCSVKKVDFTGNGWK